ncbi:MAG TPA: DNA methyltransferase [Candidatus Rubrimentiphilum sp.]|nr:DNA methyltransferase [Candidatus Rubrimentiphilum sp.]
MHQEDHSREHDQRGRTFNGLTAREWTVLSRNVWNDVSSPRNRRHLQHGAVFPVKLADRLIRIYSKRNDLVLDPFVGIGSTCISAMLAERFSIGVELSEEFHHAGRGWLDEIDPTKESEWHPTLIHGDARHITSWIAPNSIQVTVTSPPYANFISRSVRDRQRTHKKSKLALENNSRVRVYSSDVRDLGNLEYDDFLKECSKVLTGLLTVTRSSGYAVWIVKDYRLPPEQPYVPFHVDLARVAQEVGWKWHDLIVWDQNEQRSLVLLGYPSRFYTNQNCSFIVVLRRP